MLVDYIRECGKSEVLFVLYQFCTDYHSGMRSRGYRLLSRISLRGIKIVDSTELRESPIYSYLVKHYADQV
jgi:hypothetical protein